MATGAALLDPEVTRKLVGTYAARILTKLDLRDRVQAVVYAYRQGLAT